MADILHHLAKRGVSMVNEQYAQLHPAVEQEEPVIKELALWGIILIFSTFVLYFAAISAINYTYGDLVATLTMVESPHSTLLTATTAEDSTEPDAPLLNPSEKQPLKTVETDLILIKQPPVTAKFYTAIAHLRTVGGRWARFRGLHIALLYNLLHSLIVALIAPMSGDRHNPYFRALISIGASILLWRLQMTWTHVVISNPSTKPWYRRMPPLKASKHVLMATAVAAASQQATLLLTMGQMENVQNQVKGNQHVAQPVPHVAAFQFVVALLFAFSALVCLVLPAEATLRRVQASMLPEMDETIVPFDRTFGGKRELESSLEESVPAIGMLDAWKSFAREGRLRLIKVYAKVISMNVAMSVLLAWAIWFELLFIMGRDDFDKMLGVVGKHFERGEPLL